MWFPFEALFPASEQHTIVIYNKGTTTNAVEKVNGKEVKRATAKLHPEDDYKWETGRNLALNRLLYGTDYHPSEVVIHVEEPKYYNGKVVCVNNKGFDFYTIGKIYEFVDGVAYDDEGSEFCTCKITCFDAWRKTSNAEWLEIVE